MRFCRLHRSRFTGCDLTGSDLTGSQLDHVEFTGCDLSRTDFAQVKVVAARFRDCRFDGATGVAGLAGAEVDATDLVTLAGSLASALGIIVC
jgi:uncharacterized protein YjbI with pentapeptide repeats